MVATSRNGKPLAERLAGRHPMVGEDQLTLAKALVDTLREELPLVVREVLGGVLSSEVEGKASLLVTKALDAAKIEGRASAAGAEAARVNVSPLASQASALAEEVRVLREKVAGLERAYKDRVDEVCDLQKRGTAEAKELLTREREQLGDSVSVVGKMLRKEISDEMASAAGKWAEQETVRAREMAAVRDLVREEVAKALASVPSLLAEVMEKAVQGQIKTIVEVVKSLPAPVVPEGALQVKAVNVVVPEKAIVVKAEVESARRKSVTTKTILYDAGSGRPAQIVEATEDV